MRKLLSFALMIATSVTAVANPIDPRKAQAIAQEFIVPGHAMSLVSAIQPMAKAGVQGGEDASLYVFSRGAGLGYVVVSGDDCLPEVLGFTDGGDFDADNLPPALADMLEGYALAIVEARVKGIDAPLAKKVAMRAAARRNIAPLTTSHWHQSSPYNDICPCRTDNGARAMTGCVATAASQILYYWRRDLPSTLQGTTPTYSYGGAHPDVSFPKGSPVRWDLMCDSYSSEPVEYKQAVAEFCYQVGTATWLTYADGSGTATSGNIEKIPATFSGYFGMNGGWVAYRNSYSQEGWTQLIYEELAKGRPVMYTGVHPSNGGHAVYIDGYRASDDKMHFNFGWGGQGDGYWTTTLEDGMNGFNDYQSALIGAYPKKWNMTTTISQPAHVYVNQDNKFTVAIENNSTLDFTGVYMFSASNTAKPTDIKKAQSSNTDLTIARGEKGIVTLTAKPTSVKTWYITATDENLNVLAQIPVETESADAKLSGVKIETYASNETKMVGDNIYNIVYSAKVMIDAWVHNDADVAFGGTAKIDIYASDDNGATFTLLKTMSKANTVVEPKTTGGATFSLTGMEEGKLYYAEIQPEWGSYSAPTTVDLSQHNPRVYFCSAGASNMKATLNENNTLVFTGNWDAAQYQSSVTLKNNNKAVEYDLTQVEHIGSIPQVEFPMPNALVYVKESCQTAAPNIIDQNGNLVSGLYLTAGYDFLPKTAQMHGHERIALNINQEPNSWYLLTVPFSAEVPDGIIAREINLHKQTSTGINNATTNVRHLEAGKTYLVMTSSTERQTLLFDWNDSETATIKCALQTNADAAVVGTFAATPMPQGAKVIKYKETDKQYFMAADEGAVCEGLRGYFYDEKMLTSSTDFRAYSNMTLDPSYLILGQHIQMMYDAREMYAGVVSDMANKEMNDSIASAEHLFSEQTLTTAAAVKKRAQAFADWIEQYKTMVGNVGNAEVDMTSLIANPSFEESNTAAKGWTADVGTDVKIRQNSNLNYKTVYGDGANFLYNATGSRVHQTINGLKPGIYRLTAMLGGEGDTQITLAAGELTATVAAHSFGKHYLTKAEINDIEVDTNGTLEIAVSANGWYNADHFTLTFTGNSASSIRDIAIPSKPVKQGIYTLQGVKLDGITAPGVYVIDGRKVVVK